MLATVHPTLNDHEYNMRPACVVHAVWRHFVLDPSTLFSQILWSVLWLRHQFVTDATAWLINPNLSCSKNRKGKGKEKKSRIKWKEKNKIKSTVNDLDIHSIWVPLRKPCPLLRGCHRHIYPLYSFHRSRSCGNLLLRRLLPLWPNLRPWQWLPKCPLLT